ncbi:MAG: M28 family peptidase [Pseudomonadota bacterium]
MNPTEQTILDDLNLDEPWTLIERFSAFPRERPDDVNAAMDMVAERLRDFGVPHKLYEPELYLSLPGAASVKLGNRRLRAKPSSFSLSLPEGLKAPLLHVPAQAASGQRSVSEMGVDAAGLTADTVAGRIVLTEGFALPGIITPLAELGAAAVVAINPGVDIHWGTCTTIWGAPGLDDLPRKPRIPVVAVNRPDGDLLVEAAAQGKAAKVTCELEENWFRQKVLVADIAGAIEPESFALLHGHLDSWDVGVGDNATGDACMLELARVLWRHRDALRRSVKIAWWPGHSTGRYAGSTWFADAFATELDRHCVAQVDCDSPGCRWATEYTKLSCMAEARSLVTEVIQQVADRTPECVRPPRAGDYAFNNIGLSSFYMLSSKMPDDLRAEKGYYPVGGCGGNIGWHTENDTLEIADRDILMTDMKVYLLSVLRVAMGERLPFDWRLAVDDLAQTVDRYQASAGDRLDLKPAREAVDTLADQLARFYRAANNGNLEADETNTVIRRLSRILVPLDYTRGPRFDHDPALAVPPLPILSLASDLDNLDDDQRKFALAQLVRGRNRVVATLDEATGIVADVLRPS